MSLKDIFRRFRSRKNKFVIFIPGLVINSVYPIAHKLMEKTDHYRLYANLFNLVVGATFLTLHTHLGTENPLPAVLPSVAIGAAMTNRQVTEKQQSIEDKV